MSTLMKDKDGVWVQATLDHTEALEPPMKPIGMQMLSKAVHDRGLGEVLTTSKACWNEGVTNRAIMEKARRIARPTACEATLYWRGELFIKLRQCNMIQSMAEKVADDAPGNGWLLTEELPI